MTETTQTINEEEGRLLKLKDYQTSGENPYKFSFDKTHSTQDIHTTYESITHEDSCTDEINIAGRLTAKRSHGKAYFGNILDNDGVIQFYTKVDYIGNDGYEALLNLDVGDIIGITGTPFRTKRGELSLKATSVTLLSKSLLPLPEKYHGLQDKELRFRKRYVDLIANPEVKQVFKVRSSVISQIRKILDTKQFMEVETPVLQTIYGGAEARPFNTFHNELKQNLFLRISLELPLKRLIVGGFERVFEIGRVFRNEGISYKHNPEYTLLELYQAYADYNDIMNLTEELISTIAYTLHGSYEVPYKDKIISYARPFKRLTLAEALKQYANVDSSNESEMLERAKELKLDLPQNPSKIHLLAELYDHCVEPNLINPTFITDHPWETSPLAKRHRNDSTLVERFELIINGMEVANAYSELNDPIDQLNRFEDQQKAKDKGFEEAHMFDEDFVEALKYGMPPTGGLGIGIDRIVMLMTNSHSIRDVLFFPHMKPK